MKKFRTRRFVKSFIKENKSNDRVELNVEKLSSSQILVIQKKMKSILLKARKNNQSVSIKTHGKNKSKFRTISNN